MAEWLPAELRGATLAWLTTKVYCTRGGTAITFAAPRSAFMLDDNVGLPLSGLWC
jgi:hypothetical protein